MKKRMRLILSWIMAVSVLFGIGYCFTGCINTVIDEASNYTEEEHLQRVSDLVEKRYMQEGSEYTSYEVYPVYDEYEELSYFIVDFEPEGYVYIKLNKVIVTFGPSMYTRSDENEFWRPYTYAPGTECTVPDENGEMVTYEDILFRQDENGNYYGFRVSHFKAANIMNEKRYLLQIYNGTGSSRRGLVPAVKRGDKYLNLVSWEEMEFYPGLQTDECPYADIVFIGKSYFDL